MISIIFLFTGAVLFIWFLIPIIITLHFNIGSITGLAVSALLLIYGIWHKKINTFIACAWKSTLGKIAEIIILLVCACILCLAIATSVAMISAVSKKPHENSTVIVLGARVYKDRVSTAVKGRLDAAYNYLLENPEAICIVSGGQGKNEPCTESSVMYRYLTGRGIAADRIIQEAASVDTQENLKYSLDIINANKLNPDVAIATDGYHEYRALQYAKRLNIEAGAIPAKTAWWLLPTGVVREMYGILEQWFIKRTY